MAVFLSDEWIAALDEALHAETGLSDCAAVIVEQTVTGAPHGDVRYRVVIDDRGGRAHRVGPGGGVGGEAATAATPADVRLTTDYPTAVAIARGAENAQIALARGRLQLGGDVHALARFAAALAAMPGVTRALRAETTYAESA